MSVVALLLLSGLLTPAGRAVLATLFLPLALAALAFVVLAVLVRRHRRAPQSQPWSSPSPSIPVADLGLGGQTNAPSLLPNPAASPSKQGLAGSLRTLDWYQFEKVVAEVYAGYGYAVERLGGARPDGGVDLLAREPGETGRLLVVQCKHWSACEVREREVRELLGSMVDRGAGAGVLVTLRGFTEPARRLAARHPVQLLDEVELTTMLEAARHQGGSATATRLDALLTGANRRCPKCEAPMVERTATRGPRAGARFWGCSTYPRCRTTFQMPAVTATLPAVSC